MPSPIAHSAVGYILTHLPFYKKDRAAQRFLPLSSNSHSTTHLPSAFMVLYSVVVANLPDLDFLPQVITGDRFHRGPTHSLLAASIVSVVLAWLVHRYWSRARYRSLLGFTFILYVSHLLLDYFTAGGPGMQLLWPLSDRYFQAPFPLFPGVHHSRGFWDSSHLIFITAETLFSLCLFIGLRLLQNRRESQRPLNTRKSLR